MRDFIINTSEKLLLALVVFGLLIVAIAGIGAMFASPLNGMGGFLQGLAILLGGTLYVLVLAGLTFVIFGIYRNGIETNRLLRELNQR